MHFSHKFSIEKKGSELCAVFNVRKGDSSPEKQFFTEVELLAQMSREMGGGKTPAVLRDAHFELQRRKNQLS